MKQTKKATSKAAKKTVAKVASNIKATTVSAKTPVAVGVKPAKGTKKPTPVAAAPKTTVQITAPVAAPRREITTENIAACAFTLWEQSGCPQGRDVEFWLKAEQLLKQETQSIAA